MRRAPAALAVGEISQPIQSDYGYHIILRLDADNEAGQSKYADIKMNELVDQWMEEAKVGAHRGAGRLGRAGFLRYPCGAPADHDRRR